MITFEGLGENKQMMIFVFIFPKATHVHRLKSQTQYKNGCNWRDRTPGEAGLEKAM